MQAVNTQFCLLAGRLKWHQPFEILLADFRDLEHTLHYTINNHKIRLEITNLMKKNTLEMLICSDINCFQNYQLSLKQIHRENAHFMHYILCI